MTSHRTALSLLLLGALPSARAHAQFSFPFDPDFAQQETQPPAATPPEATQPASEIPVSSVTIAVSSPAALSEITVQSAPGPFLLLERTDPDRLFTRHPETRIPEVPEFESFEKTLRAFEPGPQRWERMRSDAALGVMPSEEFELPQTPSATRAAPQAPAPEPPSPEVELPSYGTSLSVAGRKIAGFNYLEKRFLNPQITAGRPQLSHMVGITQQMQLRMQGKVGPKVSVNVDYDDTKPNKQDISVVYTGNPNEAVQNASFGDIDLSLPATEFVSYNKQLFGIRADLKHKGFSSSFIGSRTKGTTKNRQFVGNTQFVSTDIPDNAYVRRQYYDLSFNNPARLPIQGGSERVYLAQQNPLGQNPPNAATFTADDLAVASSSFTGTFIQLQPGQDYTVDYVKGILTFRTPMLPQFVVAVDYVDATGHHIVSETTSAFTGGTGLFKLIKTNADIPISQSSATAAMETAFNRELKTVYSIGQIQIVRDDGRGNFILKVIDPHTRAEAGSTLDPIQKYPDTVAVDFENGTFRLAQPFGVSASTPTPDPDLYSPTPISKRLIHVEYRFRLRTFLLEPNLVLQSDIALVDGIRLVRNVDYFIDYDSGFLTFFNPQRIGPNSVVDISYEVAPFAGIASESILGTRLAYDFAKNAGIGATALFESGTKPAIVPSVADLAKSLLIYDFDGHWKDVPLFGSLKGSFQGEVAHSRLDPNLNGKALIDNMEGIRQEDAAGLLSSQWQIASNPTQAPADPLAVSWTNEDTPVLDINPNAQAKPSDTQKTLDLNYNFTVNATKEASIVFVFNPTGLDFSRRNILEVLMKGDLSNNEINFRLGGINEDADGAGGMTLNCSNGQTVFNAPKTEDTDCDGILQPSEDIGWLYSPAGKNSQRYGAGNGRIDSEDLNSNGRLDPDDGLGDDFGYNAKPGAGNNQLFDTTTSSTRTAIDFGGPMWHTFQIPLNISTATFNNWTAVKEIRISVRRRAGGAASGTLSFARVAVVGNTWLPGAAGDLATGSGPVNNEKLTVTAVNNVANPNYVPIFNAGGDAQAVFNDLYGSAGDLQRQSGTQNLSEQSLQLSWSNLAQGATVFTERIFSKPVNISQHRSFNFLLYGNADPNNVNVAGDKVFFLRVGSDRNFLEMDIPINFAGWRKFTATQTDTTGSQIPNAWVLGQGTPGTVIVSTGAPNLQQVSEIVAGVYSRGASLPAQGTAWLDEIYLSNPIGRTGGAQKMQADFDLPDWASFGFKYRAMDHNYQTPTTVVSNQDNRQDAAYLNFTRFRFMPLNLTLARTITNTPNANATGSLSNLVNLLQQGRVVNWNGAASGNLAFGAYPRLSLGYIRARTEYDLLTRTDDRNTYNSALSYTAPFTLSYAPRSVDLSYSFAKYSVSFNSPAARLTPGNFNTDELANAFGARLAFIPWTGSSFNPSLSLTEVKERRGDMTSGVEIVSRYPKAMNETLGFSSNFRLLQWLNPAVNYSINTIENNILNVSTFVIAGSTNVFNAGDLKTVNRSANGSLSLPINIADIFPAAKCFRSLNLANSYQLQDGDVWNNVEKELDARLLLSVRAPLHPSSVAAQLANRTLRDAFNSTQRWSPLEAFGLSGRLAAFKTLALSNNLVRSIQRTEITGTRSKTIATTIPDIVASLGQIEKLLRLERWVSNQQINVKYAAHRTENAGLSLDTDDAFGADLRAILLRRLDTTLSLNRRSSLGTDLRSNAPARSAHHEDATLQTTFDIQKFRFTPKVDYNFDAASQGGAAQTQNVTVITPSALVRADLSLPRGLLLPFRSKPLLFTNRIIWTNTMSLAFRSSPVTAADNSKLLVFNTSADYELAKNLRMTLNGAFSRLWHKYIAEEDFISYQLGTTFTLQF